MVYTDIHVSPDGGFKSVQTYTDYICELIETERKKGPLVAEEGRDVDVLLAANKDRIVHLRVEASKFASQTHTEKYLDCDEWLLRYALSFNKNDAALEAIKKCLAWRSAPEIKKFEHAVENQLPVTDGPDLINEMKKYMVSRYVGTMKDGGFIMFDRSGMGSTSRLMNEIGDTVFWVFLGQRELIGQVQLAVMKRSRRLIKFAMVVDLKGSRLSEMGDRRFLNTFSKVSKISGDVWPQLVQNLVLVNPPTFFWHTWGLVKRVLPKKTLEKLEIVKDNSQFGSNGFVKEWLRPELIPAFLGGALEDLPLELTGRLLIKDLRSLSMRIPARSSRKVYSQQLLEGAYDIEYDLSVPGYGVEFWAFVEQGIFDDEVLTDKGHLPFTPKGEPRSLLEKMKLKDNSTASVSGTWHVEGPCQVTIVMNNDWSLVRSKDAKYLLNVRHHKEDPSLEARLGGMSVA